jgi:hypothetical protein
MNKKTAGRHHAENSGYLFRIFLACGAAFILRPSWKSTARKDAANVTRILIQVKNLMVLF